MKPLKQSSLFLLCLLGALHTSSLLAAPLFQEPNKNASTTLTKVSAVAYVNLSDVTSKKTVANSLTKIDGTFTLTASVAEQNDISYGIFLRDTISGKLFDSTKLGTIPVILVDQKLPVTFSYTLPKWVSGNVTINLVVETSKGLPLGISQLYKETLPVKKAPFSCSLSKVPSSTLSCAFASSSTITGEYKVSGFGTSVPEANSISGGAGTKKDLSLSYKTPGQYLLFLTDKETLYRQVIPYTIAGSYGSILNSIVTNVDSKTAHIKTALQASNVRKLTLSYALKDSGGKVCGSGVGKPEGAVVETDINSSCGSGTVTVKLLTENNAVLDSRDVTFSLPPGAPKAIKKSSLVIPETYTQNYLTSIFLPVLSLFVILGIIALGVYLYRRKFPGSGPASGASTTIKVLLPLLLGVELLGGTPKVDALTTYVSNWYNGDIVLSAAVTVSTDKSSYAPGGVVTINTNYSPSDQGYYYQDWSASLGYASEGNNTSVTPKLDTALGASGGAPAIANYRRYLYYPAYSTMTPAGTNKVDTLTLSNSVTSGNHNLSLRLIFESCMNADCVDALYGDIVQGMTIDWLPITIAAPAPIICVSFGGDCAPLPPLPAVTPPASGTCEVVQLNRPDASSLVWDTVGTWTLSLGQSKAVLRGGRNAAVCTASGAVSCSESGTNPNITMTCISSSATPPPTPPPSTPAAKCYISGGPSYGVEGDTGYNQTGYGQPVEWFGFPNSTGAYGTVWGQTCGSSGAWLVGSTYACNGPGSPCIAN